LRDIHLAQYPDSSVILGHLAPVHRSTAVGFYFSAVCLLIACLLACPLRWLSKREFAATEARNSVSNIPPDFTGPGYHGACDFTGPIQAGDGEWLAVDPSQGLTNYAACLSDAISRNSDQPDYHLEQQYPQLLPSGQNPPQNASPTDGLGSPSAVLTVPEESGLEPVVEEEEEEDYEDEDVVNVAGAREYISF
uniref:C-type lectin domain-containing protein n=1 Tax=Echinostoma caproni TaxID=27848 RepID=A0A183A6I5_9TREM